MTNKPGKVFLFGASGHAKVVADIVACAGGTLSCVADDDARRKGARIGACKVIGGRDELVKKKSSAGRGIVAIGANAARRAVAQWLESKGFAFATAVHPKAVVARDARIGAGSAVMAGAVINSDTVIGRHCIVNTGASVDHDCAIGDGVHIAPGARLCGGVAVGAGAFIGAGAVIVPGRRIGADAIIAAGAVVLADVPDGGIAAGNPARLIRQHDPSRGKA